MTKIEEVAQAIKLANNELRLDTTTDQGYKIIAMTAIEAMRVPNTEMVQAMLDNETNVRDQWEAAIDAALNK